MEYTGKSSQARVRIVATSGWLSKYNGQECDAIIYEGGVRPQIDTEQLTPPIPRWQTADPKEIEVVGADSETVTQSNA